MSELPTDFEVGGDTFAVRTFAVRDGRLTSIAQGNGHWNEGRCLAICTVNPDDPDRMVDPRATARPIRGSRQARHRRHTHGGACIEGDRGVKSNAAEIVAWWVADCDDTAMLAAACEASAPGTRRFFDRDVMIGLYPPPPERRN